MKILIIENDAHHHKILYDTLNERFGNRVEVFPVPDTGSVSDIHFHAVMMERYALKKEKLPELLEAYPDIDLFIIDINLKGRMEEKYGEEIYKFLDEVFYRKGDFKTIFISSNPWSNRDIQEGKNNRIAFIHKRSDVWEERIADRVKLFYPGLAGAPANNNTAGVQQAAPAAMQQQAAAATPPVATYVPATYGSGGQPPSCKTKILKGTEDFDSGIRKLLHALITIMFYGLMGYAAFFACRHIIHGFNAALADGLPDTKLFKPIEDIFIFLLPLFVLTGFYIYYKMNASAYLLNEPRYNMDDKTSTRVMSITKMMFISSLLSFVTLKCIELVFDNSCTAQFTVTMKMISAGVLLTLIMLFFIIMYRKEH